MLQWRVMPLAQIPPTSSKTHHISETAKINSSTWWEKNKSDSLNQQRTQSPVHYNSIKERSSQFTSTTTYPQMPLLNKKVNNTQTFRFSNARERVWTNSQTQTKIQFINNSTWARAPRLAFIIKHEWTRDLMPKQSNYSSNMT